MIKDMNKLYEIAGRDTKYNDKSHAVVSKGDEWIEETEWEEMYKEEK